MFSKQIVKRVFKYMSRANGDVPIKIVFPDGKEYQTASGTPKVTIIFKSKAVLRLWSVYLLGSIEGFNSDSQRLNVFHIVFTKGRNLKSYPNKRDFFYANHK
jgi:hypothetical protein